MAAGPVAWTVVDTANSLAKGDDSRFPQLTLEQLNAEERALGKKIMKVSSDGLNGPYNPMFRNPVYAAHVRPARLLSLAHVRAD